jgi:PAS domain-containing protein
MIGMGGNMNNQFDLIHALNNSQMQAAVSIFATMQQASQNPNHSATDSNPSRQPTPPFASLLSSGFSPALQQQQLQHQQNPLAMAVLVQQLQQQFAMTQQSPPGSTSSSSLESFLAAYNYNPNVLSNQGNTNHSASNHNDSTSTSGSVSKNHSLASAQAIASLLQAQHPFQPLLSYPQPQQQQQQQNPQSSTAIPKVSSHSSESSDDRKRKASSSTETTTGSTTTGTASNNSMAVPDADLSEVTSVSESQDATSSSVPIQKSSPKKKKKLPKNADVGFRLPSTTATHHLPLQQQHQQQQQLHVQYNPMTVQSIHPSISNQTLSPLVMSQIQKQSLPELEHHVKLMMELNQPIPHQVWLLLQEKRAVEEKKMAKRLVNRKSASTSRARKKKLVEEMAQNNARLRRQAIILSLLPDLVMAITTDGEITFCSGQVERVLRHKIDDMIGMNISKLITPASQDALAKLIESLLAADKVAVEDGNNESGRSSNSGNTSGAPMVSEQSDQGFPLSVVKVNSFKDSSDSSGNDKVAEPVIAPSPSMQSKDDADTSDPSNLSTANEALDRNVRSHNELLKQKKAAKKKANAHKDDVTGDTVTANNADARLSSLLQPHESVVKNVTSVENLEDMTSSSSDSLLGGVEDKRHKKRKPPENASDDSGYREDSGSSTSETSNSGRRRTLVPTCNICLIRDDLSTIWCEVTSSVRTRHIDEHSIHGTQTATSSQDDKRSKTDSATTSDDQKIKSSSNQVKELLLCLRPLRDGTEKVSEELRFLPKKTVVASTQNHVQSSDSGTKNSVTGSGSAGEGVSSCSKSSSSAPPGHSETVRPMKKRRPTMTFPPSEEETINAVVSLVRLSNSNS